MRLREKLRVGDGCEPPAVFLHRYQLIQALTHSYFEELDQRVLIWQFAVRVLDSERIYPVAEEIQRVPPRVQARSFLTVEADRAQGGLLQIVLTGPIARFS